jgi:AAA family ATPase
MRPGRLDRILWVGPPDQRGREEILRIKIRKMTVGSDLNVESIAELVMIAILCRISTQC